MEEAHTGCQRVEDLLLGSLLTIIAIIPALCIAIVLKLVEQRPVFYCQPRVGWQGREFVMYKFTTMSVHESDTATRPVEGENDPRLTSFGGWLRRHGLDEIPQLMNVLRGDMSLVGPRPFPVVQDRQFQHLHRDYSLRRTVRPGITGLAQLSGSRNPEATQSGIRQLMTLDLSYLERRSVMYDLQILLKTLLHIIAK